MWLTIQSIADEIVTALSTPQSKLSIPLHAQAATKGKTIHVI
jgi:hypothetical protein